MNSSFTTILTKFETFFESHPSKFSNIDPFSMRFLLFDLSICLVYRQCEKTYSAFIFGAKFKFTHQPSLRDKLRTIMCSQEKSNGSHRKRSYNNCIMFAVPNAVEQRQHCDKNVIKTSMPRKSSNLVSGQI